MISWRSLTVVHVVDRLSLRPKNRGQVGGVEGGHDRITVLDCLSVDRFLTPFTLNRLGTGMFRLVSCVHILTSTLFLSLY